MYTHGWILLRYMGSRMGKTDDRLKDSKIDYKQM